MLNEDRDEIKGVISDDVSESARICLENCGGDSTPKCTFPVPPPNEPSILAWAKKH